PGGPHGHSRRDPRARAPRRRKRLPAFLPHHRADGAAHPHGQPALLRHLQLHGLQHHLDHHQGRPVRSDAGALDVRVPAGHQRGLSRQGRGDLALHVPPHGRDGVCHAPLPATGEHVKLWRRLRPHAASWLGLLPFLAFALFPFYWAIITSFKADANLYDLTRQPFWFSKTDGLTNEPYHKDIIVPASYRDGT